jgi:hypothetical protein
MGQDRWPTRATMTQTIPDAPAVIRMKNAVPMPDLR